MVDIHTYYEMIEAATGYIQSKTKQRPKLALVLGSGWDMLIEKIENPERISYKDVPGMKPSGVMGHAGEWVFGRVSNVPVMVMSGRYHLYEGHDLKMVTLPIRVMKAFGIEKLILTNAAGAINTDFEPGDMMLISDHINLTSNNSLIGANDERLGDRFFDMTNVYDKAMRETARQLARELSFTLREGVYAQMTGPCFETPAEIRMLRTLGADAIGMSTVPEATVAAHAKMATLGLSCMTNMAAGVLDQPLSHAEVLETAARVRVAYGRFMTELVRRI